MKKTIKIIGGILTLITGAMLWCWWMMYMAFLMFMGIAGNDIHTTGWAAAGLALGLFAYLIFWDWSNR